MLIYSHVAARRPHANPAPAARLLSAPPPLHDCALQLSCPSISSKLLMIARSASCGSYDSRLPRAPLTRRSSTALPPVSNFGRRWRQEARRQTLCVCRGSNPSPPSKTPQN